MPTETGFMDIQYGKRKGAWQAQAPYRHGREVPTFYPNYKKQIPLHGQPRTVFFITLLATWPSRAVIALFYGLRGYMSKHKFYPRFDLDFFSSGLQALGLASKTGPCHGPLRLESYFHNHYLAGGRRSLIFWSLESILMD